MRCASCDHDNRVSAAFCEACGTRVPAPCPHCGAALRIAARFCDACGCALEGAAAAPALGVMPAEGAAPLLLAGDRYVVKDLLGEGSRKRVYLAHDARLERHVAIALIKTSGLDQAGLVRVRREVRAMGRLGDHPRIVTVYDVGEDGGQPFIVSQYMAGGTLDDLLHRSEGRRLPIDQALRLAAEVCEALEHAHANGIVHRDLKPANVWLAADGGAHLGDFGLALTLSSSRVTVEGMMVGTVVYMPPEQALGRTPDGRSDLYALGTMLYEMVTGRPPFLGDDAVAIIAQHLNTLPVAPTWHNAAIPPGLEALILRLLAKAPDDRPESAAAVRQTLLAIAAAAAGTAPDNGGAAAVPRDGNPLDALAGGVFVGRERELAELRRAVDETAAARGRLVMLAGEPGIGKTRTVETIATYARIRGLEVLVGRCYEEEGAPAYWPWIQIIRAHAAVCDPAILRAELGAGAAEIARVVSEVRERIVVEVLPMPPDPDQARFRFFASVTDMLGAAARSRPLMLILEDLHWADKPSLLLLEFLARELREGGRILVVGTYRDAGLARDHALSQTLSELARSGVSHRLPMQGLTESQVGRFIEMTTGQAPRAELVTAVHRETDGNPFFVTEVVRLLATDTAGEPPGTDADPPQLRIPQTVREVIGKRLARLSPGCNRVLAIAAVIGRTFGLDVLERLASGPSEGVLDAIEEAEEARIVAGMDGQAGRFSFQHALFRDTLYEEMTATRRARLHRQVGEALEGLYGGEDTAHVGELAYHFFAAGHSGDLAKALDYSLRAAKRAAMLMAHEQAVEHYDDALRVLAQRGREDEGERCSVLLRLGEQLWRAGDAKRARLVFEEAVALARRLGVAEQVAQAALGFGGWHAGFDTGRLDRTLVALLEEALAVLGDAETPLRAMVLARLGEALTFADPEGRRFEICRRAYDIARRSGDRAVVAYALRAAHWAVWSPDNLEERLALAKEFVALADEVDNDVFKADSRVFLLADLLEKGDFHGAMEVAQVAEQLAIRSRQPYTLWGMHAVRALFAITAGRFEEGERIAAQALEIGGRAHRQAPMVFGIQMAMSRWERGLLADVEAGIEGFAAEFPLLPIFRCALAPAHFEAGRVDDARAEFERFAATDFMMLPRDFTWLVGMAFLAEACVRLADQPRAQILYELLAPFADRCITTGVISYCAGALAQQLGLLATLLERWGDAVRHFEAALAMNERIGARPHVAHTQAGYAAMLARRAAAGDREKALGLVARALATAQELGMPPLVQECLALKLHLQAIDRGRPQTSLDAVAAAAVRERPDLRRAAAPDGTVTILFTDIEDSTRLTEQLGDQRWLDVLRAHNALVRREVVLRRGTEVKAQGDGFMIAFPSARRAIQCAMAIQRAVAAYNAEHGAPPIAVRIGLHTGEALHHDDDFFGRNVALAARIADQAKGGQILVSALVKELTESGGDLAFDGGRDVALKGLSGSHRLFAVTGVSSR